jgi:hypothetical protein
LPRRQSHQQGVRNQLSGHAGSHRPGNHPAREQVDYGGHTEPTPDRPDAGEVGDPLLVRPLGLELSVQQVGDDSSARMALIQPGQRGAGSGLRLMLLGSGAVNLSLTMSLQSQANAVAPENRAGSRKKNPTV